VCRDRLICVESLGPSGRPTGDYTCTSFCNFSPVGAGLGDGCASDQTCGSSLTPTANLHGCAVSTDIGAKLAWQSCSRDDECRSGNCDTDGRLAGGGNQKYCQDYCGSDAYCPSGTTCQLWGGYSARCYSVLSAQARDFGQSCTNSGSGYCRAGYWACVSGTCTKVCCRNSDCPAGYACALEGGDYPGPIGGYDTAPVCWPLGSGAHNRLAGAACTSNGQCASEFCDVSLGVCVDLCCHDATCPQGLRCESAVVTRSDGHQTFARVCLNLSPTDALEAMP
jgi:hypothetical protein